MLQCLSLNRNLGFINYHLEKFVSSEARLVVWLWILRLARCPDLVGEALVSLRGPNEAFPLRGKQLFRISSVLGEPTV